MRNTKKTNEEFKNEVHTLVQNEYIFIDEYVNTNTKLEVMHRKCGLTYKVTPNNFINNCRRCPYCYGSFKKSNEEFLKQVKELVNNEYIFLEEYSGTNLPIKCIHNECNYIWKITPSHFLNGKRCPKCQIKIRSRKQTKNKDIFLKEVKKLVGDEYTFLEDYINSTTKLKIIHNKCGHKYSIRPQNFLNGTRCPVCNGNIKVTHKEFVKKVKNLVKNEYTFREEYKNNKTPLKVIHNKCTHEYHVTPHNFIDSSRRCSKCGKSKKFSNKEKSLSKFIKKVYNKRIIENDRTILDGKEIDIYLPDLKIGIEYCGLYWHSDKRVGKNYHLDKLKLCHKKGIRLIQIFEDEWDYKNKILKSKIKHILGLNSSKESIYARKCTIKEIDSTIKNEFLDKYHIQGKDMSNIKLGLFYNEKLVSVMTFKIPRNKKENTYELSRFTTKRKYNVVGGFSKLLSYFKKNYEFSSIITYADLRYSSFEGNLYEVNGFRLSHQSKPTYTYFQKNYSIKDRIRIHKTNFRKSKIKEIFPEIYDEKLTEFEMMDKSSYYRIYDCGTLVYTLNK